MKKLLITSLILTLTLVGAYLYFQNNEWYSAKFSEWGLKVPKGEPTYTYEEENGFTANDFDIIKFTKSDKQAQSIQKFVESNKSMLKAQYDQTNLGVISLLFDNTNHSLLTIFNDEKIVDFYLFQPNNYASFYIIETESEFVYIFVKI